MTEYLVGICVDGDIRIRVFADNEVEAEEKALKILESYIDKEKAPWYNLTRTKEVTNT